MKVKARIEKFVNFNAMNVPCTGLEFKQLRDGKEGEVDNEVADKMLATGIVEKVSNKKSKKSKEKK